MSPRVHARTLAAEQRAISVSEFFAKNRHLLGFDSPSRALLTTVKEAVDNAIDACEEAGLLPEVVVEIEKRDDDRYVVAVEDGGPGIVEEQIARIFGKLLYGSKFHRLSQSRGQQGMGISAAGMYGQMTTGEPMRIISRTDSKSPAHELLVSIDTRKNRPEIHDRSEIEWERKHGTRVEIAMDGQYQHGQHSVALYLKLTSVANPHVAITLKEPDGTVVEFRRSVRKKPPLPRRIKPHPHGVELGRLISMLKATEAKHLEGFLRTEFSQVGRTRAREIIDRAGKGLSRRSYPKRIAKVKAAALHGAIQDTKISAPPMDCVVPIGEKAIREGLTRELPAAFYAIATRPPAVYRGNPFLVEVGLAYGREDAPHVVVSEDGHLRKVGDQEVGRAKETARLIRYANRVPLLYQRAHCITTAAVADLNWRRYGLEQSTGSLPVGPMTILIHVASVWVPFTSESKDAIAEYPEIRREIELALQTCGRELGAYLKKERRLERELSKRSAIERFLPYVSEALGEILELSDDERQQVEDRLDDLLQQSRRVP
jgi:DNA topoisomerase-6 subunit B